MPAPEPLRSAKLSALLAACLLVAVGLMGCGPGASEQRRTDYLSAHPEMSANTRTLIQNGQVAPGMTKDQVLAAWGSPPSDCKSWQSNLMAIWDYCHHPGRTLVIFDRNGRVSNVQQP
jgi:outer membrane protein assembly factor BamE (lipoprotein component of BamABCDE complex)